jgi:hypothetical protein
MVRTYFPWRVMYVGGQILVPRPPYKLTPICKFNLRRWPTSQLVGHFGSLEITYQSGSGLRPLRLNAHKKEGVVNLFLSLVNAHPACDLVLYIQAVDASILMDESPTPNPLPSSVIVDLRNEEYNNFIKTCQTDFVAHKSSGLLRM